MLFFLDEDFAQFLATVGRKRIFSQSFIKITETFDRAFPQISKRYYKSIFKVSLLFGS